MRLPTLAVSLALALVLTGTARAQIFGLRGTGCIPAPTPATQGTPNLGGTVTVDWRCGALVPGLLVGLRQNPAVSVSPPLVCGTVACTLAVRPLLVVTGPPNGAATVAIQIPNNQAVLGTILAVQGLCFDASAACFTLSTALLISPYP